MQGTDTDFIHINVYSTENWKRRLNLKLNPGLQIITVMEAVMKACSLLWLFCQYCWHCFWVVLLSSSHCISGLLLYHKH